jgi:hypothetical protein
MAQRSILQECENCSLCAATVLQYKEFGYDGSGEAQSLPLPLQNSGCLSTLAVNPDCV